MWRRRSGNVHGVHLFVVNQFLGIVVPFGNPSFLGVGLSLVAISAHDGHYFGVLYFLKCRSAFVFGHFSATDESPFNYSLAHNLSLILLFLKIEFKVEIIQKFRFCKFFQTPAVFFRRPSGTLGTVDETADTAHLQQFILFRSRYILHHFGH